MMSLYVELRFVVAYIFTLIPSINLISPVHEVARSFILATAFYVKMIGH